METNNSLIVRKSDSVGLGRISRSFAMSCVGDQRFSPGSVYRRLILLCFLAHHVRLGVAIESASKEGKPK